MKKSIFNIALTGSILFAGISLPVHASAASPADNSNLSTMFEKSIVTDTPITKEDISNLSSSEIELLNSGWIPAETIKGSTKFNDMITSKVAIGLAGTIGYATAGPVSAALTPMATSIVTGNIKTVWYTSKRSFQMAGATLQIKYDYTTYKDSARKKKITSATWITNDIGGKSVPVLMQDQD